MTRRLGRMLILAAAWVAAAAVAAVIAGRAIRLRDHPPVPQLDDPLRRGTDLDPSPCPGSAHGLCLRGCALDDACPALIEAFQRQAAATSAAWHEDGGNLADHLPGDPSAGLFGAVQMLATATDETSARYWLAVCARRGATWEQQRDLWAEWQTAHARNVTYLHTDPDPEDPHA